MEPKDDRINTTELESYKQVEPRDGGKKLCFAIRTCLSLALEVEILQVWDLCFALGISWLNREKLLTIVVKEPELTFFIKSNSSITSFFLVNSREPNNLSTEETLDNREHDRNNQT